MRAKITAFCLTIFLTTLLEGLLVSTSRADDELVTFFPTYGAQSADGTRWEVNVHAWIYEAETSSLTRRALLSLLVKNLGLGAQEAESRIFQERARFFLADNERGEEVRISLGSLEAVIGPSETSGHIETKLSFAAVSLKDSQVKIERKDSRGQGAESVSAIPLLAPEGISVISDLDDTIKISDVANRRALLKNTFCEEFRAVPKMAELYRDWSERGGAFHYVSASPWQLYPPLQEFLRRNGFPAGSFSLKTFRWKDSSFFDLFAKSDEIKRPFIEGILKSFPKRQFILVGDTGEADPELYAAIARSYRKQVSAIFIRKSSGKNTSDSRWDAAFSGLASDIWQVFSDPAEVRDKAEEIFENSGTSAGP